MGDKFKPGDVVRLKSDRSRNNLMTVEKSDGGDVYICAWFNEDGDKCRSGFTEDILDLG